MNQQRFPTIIRIGRWCVRVAPRVGFGLLVLFVLAAIPWTYFNIKWGRELEATLAELKAQGMPLTLAEAAPKPVPDSQNAARLYQRVFQVDFDSGKFEGKMGGLSDEEQVVFGSYLKERSFRLEHQVDALVAQREVQEALDIFRRGSQRPYSVFPVNWEDGPAALFPHLTKFRTASWMLSAQALLLADEGRVDEALDWCRVSLRMSEHVAEEPILIAELVGIRMQAVTLDAVEQIVSATDIHPALAHEFEQYLRQINLYETLTAAMIAERGGGRELFDQLPKQHYKFFYDLGIRPCPLRLRLYASWLGSPVQKLDQLTYLKYKGGVIEASKLPYRQAESQIEALEEDMAMKPFYLVVTRLLTSVFLRATQQRDVGVAKIGLCRMALALKAYKYEHGAYPETLDKLEQTLDWQLPEDPFSGEDFVYQRQGEGFKLYSIGQDLKDSGGQPRDESRPYYDPDRDFDIVWECSS